jgi:hypothetical protein
MLKKVSNKLEGTKGKISKHWGSYRTEKKHILSLKKMPLDLKRGLITEAREKTYKDISVFWSGYRDYKDVVVSKSDIEDFILVKKLTSGHWTDPKTKKVKHFKYTESEQKVFRASEKFEGSDWDDTIEKILNRKNVKGVVTTLKVKDEAGNTRYISDFINKNKLKSVHDEGKTIEEHIGIKAKGDKSLAEFELQNYLMRVVYEKA